MKKIFETPNDGHYFCGYYDKSPFNDANTLLLACRARFMDRAVMSGDVLEIGYFDLENPNCFVKITETRAWNWQQGCMLQWVSRGKYDEIIYNDILNNKFVTIIFNIKTLEKKIYSKSYYTMDSDAQSLLCIDNERHFFFRKSYSYRGIENYSKNVPVLENDGIWKIDTATERCIQIVTLGELLKVKPLTNMTNAIHYVEHLMLRPDGKRFMFLHRWKLSDGGIYTRLYTCDIDGTNLYLLHDSGRVTHQCWRNNNEIVGWAGLVNPINGMRRNKVLLKYLLRPLLPIYKFLVKGNSIQGYSRISALVSGDSYVIMKDLSLEKVRISKNILDSDGHPSFSSIDPNTMLTDTYPIISDYNRQQLILYDLKNMEITQTLKFHHEKTLNDSPMRCDLHPKWSQDGRLVSIDTIQSNRRGIHIYEI